MTKVLDMTNEKDNIYKLILSFAVPLLIGNLFQQLFTFCDTIISTNLIGTFALSAIGATASILYFVVALSNGMGAGASILVSKHFGNKDDKKIRNTIFSVVVINIIISAILSTLILSNLNNIFYFLKVPQDIYNHAKDYFKVMIFGLVCTLLFNTLQGIIRALGNSTFPLITLIITVILNIILDVVFLKFLNLGLFGSGLATIISQLVSVVILIIYIYKVYPLYKVTKKDIYFEKENVFDIVTTGLSMGVMNSIYAIGGILMTRSINSLGTDILNARTAGRKLIELLMAPLGSLANSCSVFVSQNYGAKKIKRATDGIKKTIITQFIWSCVIFIIIPFEREIVSFISNSNDDVMITNAVNSINFALPFYFPLGCLFTLRLSFQSLSRKIIPLISSSIELVIKLISAFILIPKFGFFGEYITEPISWLTCFIFVATIYIVYRKTKVFELQLQNKK